MNTLMWKNRFTERHIMSTGELRVSLIPPVTRRLACGFYGNGAKAEPSSIYYTVDFFLPESNVVILKLKDATLNSERNKSTFALKCSNETSNASRALSHGARMIACLSYLNGAAALRLGIGSWHYYKSGLKARPKDHKNKVHVFLNYILHKYIVFV
ncbi:PREDICTED: phosphopantothenoylcysteine decarboxylase [Prunus dulcis]|uniref:PREDICTED: phosphopantothenoylcysteine decarboxylase n=1 Tax=Prunus dulcis TaxID=3755 RepID=A0A5E4F7N8_PRUDU|nr:PREDICTED: phosphopantothenoylcysteine decarboxylase [Prunus dulcis]